MLTRVVFKAGGRYHQEWFCFLYVKSFCLTTQAKPLPAFPSKRSWLRLLKHLSYFSRSHIHAIKARLHSAPCRMSFNLLQLPNWAPEKKKVLTFTFWVILPSWKESRITTLLTPSHPLPTWLPCGVACMSGQTNWRPWVLDHRPSTTILDEHRLVLRYYLLSHPALYSPVSHLLLLQNVSTLYRI